MKNGKMIAIVGMGALLPDAFDVPSFWNNVVNARYSVTEVPADRWNTDLYYDPDHSAVDKTYSKIGAFVRGYQFDPLKNGLIIPPKLLSAMDFTQQWAIAVSQQALKDYGYPERKLNPERVAVIFGNANAGEYHYRSTFRILLPEYIQALKAIPDFENLPEPVREGLIKGFTENIRAKSPAISEDTMPGELSNIIAGRVANIFNFTGPNFVTDAACASSLAAIQAACQGLLEEKFDAVLTGGIDRHMGPESYIKFCKIGALSADGSRPYSDGANGFVMGEGAVVFLMKRLEDAERDADRIYAVIRGIGGSSDGKGKGITAPNPAGQQLAISRAWQDAQVAPQQVGLVEGHGTSTKVGDVAEVASLDAIFGPLGLKNSSVVLGSIKSNIGHLKGAAGAAGLLKTVLALHHQTLPPTVNFERPNPNIDFAHLPFRVINAAQEWQVKEDGHRIAGVSAFGFGGTNFHVVMEEYFPGISGDETASHTVPAKIETMSQASISQPSPLPQSTAQSREVSGVDVDAVREFVLSVVAEKTGYPVEMLELDLDLEADLGIDTVKQAELFATVRTHYDIPRREDLKLSDYNTLAKVVGFVTDAHGSGKTDATVNVQVENATAEPPSTLPAASPAMTDAVPDEPLKPYQGLFFASASDIQALQAMVQHQIAVLKSGGTYESHCPSGQELAGRERIAIDYAADDELVKRLEKTLEAFKNDTPSTWKAMQAHGVYRGSGKPGKVAFLFPGQGSQYVNMLLDLRDTEPLVRDTFDEADRIMTPILGRPLTSFIYTNGTDEELKKAEQELKNTAITQPAMLTANVAVMRVLNKYGVHPDMVIGHSLGEYAALVAAGVLSFAEALEVVSARGREMSKIKVEDPGCMAAVSAPLEKVQEIIQSIDGYVVIANINSPLQSVLGGSTEAIDRAIALFTEAGFQASKIPVSHAFHTKIVAPASEPLRSVIARMNVRRPTLPVVANVTGELYPADREAILDLLADQVASPVQFVKGMQTLYREGVRVFIESGPKRVLNALAQDNLKDLTDVAIIATNHPRKGGKASFNEALCGIYAAGVPATNVANESAQLAEPARADEAHAQPGSFDGTLPITGSVVITGAGLGLPGKKNHVFDDDNINKILRGEMRIEGIDDNSRQAILEKHVTRLVKSDAGAVMEEITDLDKVVKLAGQSGEFDLADEFGVPEDRVEALDISSKLAIAAGIEALRDAGIPLVMSYRKTTKGTWLPDRWKLPVSMRDDTGVIFGSAFPGLNRIVEESDRFYQVKLLERQLEEVRSLMEAVKASGISSGTSLLEYMECHAADLEARIGESVYQFDRRYVFRILAMGHSQFAEYIGARGPNTHVNAACATTTHALSVAEDWIRTGRCRRVVVISGDDVTKENSLAWIGSGLFASGAATSEGNLRLAAIPFDKRRNGMIVGMGAAALVVESEDAARERGVRGIGEILSSVTANSAFHGTRLDELHVSEMMDRLLQTAERRFGIDRHAIAHETVFMSHETYTPARGGSASAEIHALRACFGEQANQVIIANTKGFTGHSMGVGIEDVVVTKALETGIVPPIAHIQDGFEPDPELGDLNLSKGGAYNPQYSLRLGAGFGSQIAMTLVRRIPGAGERIDRERYSKWLASVSGHDHAETERVNRTLRIKDQGVPANEPAASTWQYGYLPSQWAMSRITASEPNPVVMPASVPVHSTEVEPKPSETQSMPTPASSSPQSEEIKRHVLAEVSEKTGYPVEMLDLDLDLEADLGIDTVKQAELFAAIRTHYGIPRREDLILADYNTLSRVIGFVEENLGGAGQALIAEAAPSPIVAQDQEVAPTPSAETEAIKAHVLSVVSEKTGYPTDMLDLDLDLEADLGIDTVKQAELFAAIRTHYGIPRREDLILAEYNTLAKVIGFVEDALAATSQQATDAADGTAAENSEKETSAAGEASGSLAFRAPALVLLPKTELCQKTDVLLANREVLIVANSTKTGSSLSKKLKAAKANPVIVDISTVKEKVEQMAKAGTLAGVYYLAGLESTFDLQSSPREAWVPQRSQLLDPLFDLAKVLPESAFLVCATSMGGLLGFINSENPSGGLVSGFTKALKRERPGQLIKVVDFSSAETHQNIAEILVKETMNDPVTVEIGYEGGSRFSVKLNEMDMQAVKETTLPKGCTFVVSGATGGITAPVLFDLAKATQGSFYLLGRTKLPSKEDANLQMLKNDRNAFRKELQKRSQEKGEKVTPVQLDQKITALERAASMIDLLDSLRSTGAAAKYILCDVTDPQDVDAAVAEIKHATDHVDVFIHAAGIEKSRKVESKSAEEFEQTVAVKVDGFQFLFKALENAGRLPGSIVSFSSVAGRFGNAGQTDYSAANDALSKLAFWLPSQYPALHSVSLDWGAWAEVGMASRGNIPALMERAGIEMLKPETAAPMVRQALELGLCGEYVVAGSLGSLDSGCQNNCGVDVETANQALRAGDPIHKMFSSVTAFSVEQGIRLEAELDPAQEFYLHDHMINGIPVLPGVMGIEGFSVAAKHIASVLGSNHAPFEVSRLENVQFLAPFKFYGNKARTIQWNAVAFRTLEGIRVEARLESDVTRRNGGVEHMLHFTGTVFLTPDVPAEEQMVKPPKWNQKNSVSSDDIYKLFFHGPSFQVLESAQLSNGKVLGKFNKKVVEIAADDPALFATPLLIEMCFQTAGLYQAGATGVLALPQSVGSLKLFKRPLNGVAIFAEVNPRMEGESYVFDARVVDAKGNVFLELTDYRTSALPYPAEQQLVEPLKKLVPLAGD
ncbi:MAG: SDR family NAD(P)-dependent oxidoreductase [Anaerolineaceae bacterium]